MKLPNYFATNAIGGATKNYPASSRDEIVFSSTTMGNDNVAEYKKIIAIARARITGDCHENCKDPSNINDRSELLGIYEACTRCAEARAEETKAYIDWNNDYLSGSTTEKSPYPGGDPGHLKAVLYSAIWADAARQKLDS